MNLSHRKNFQFWSFLYTNDSFKKISIASKGKRLCFWSFRGNLNSSFWYLHFHHPVRLLIRPCTSIRNTRVFLQWNSTLCILYLYLFSECKKCNACNNCPEPKKIGTCNKSNGECECSSAATFTFNKTIVLFTAFLIFLSHQYWKHEEIIYECVSCELSV